MMVIDSHLDLSWNALNWNRDLRSSVEDIRRVEAGMQGAAPRRQHRFIPGDAPGGNGHMSGDGFGALDDAQRNIAGL